MNSTQIVPRLQFVADEEKVNMTEDGKKALITLAQGDMRKVRMIMIKMSMILKKYKLIQLRCFPNLDFSPMMISL